MLLDIIHFDILMPIETTILKPYFLTSLMSATIMVNLYKSNVHKLTHRACTIKLNLSLLKDLLDITGKHSLVSTDIVMQICDVIKQNELELANVYF